MRDRIRLFLEKENKTSSKFAEEIGIQPSGVSHVLSGRNKPSLDFILKMLNAYTEINSDWLLFGRGEMYKSAVNTELLLDNENKSDNNDKEKLTIEGLFNPDNEAGEDENADQERSYGNDIYTNVNERFSERIIIFYHDGTYKEYNRRK